MFITIWKYINVKSEILSSIDHEFRVQIMNDTAYKCVIVNSETKEESICALESFQIPVLGLENNTIFQVKLTFSVPILFDKRGFEYFIG